MVSGRWFNNRNLVGGRRSVVVLVSGRFFSQPLVGGRWFFRSVVGGSFKGSVVPGRWSVVGVTVVGGRW